MKYDMVLKNGRVVDSANNIDTIIDLGIKNGRIVKIDKNIKNNETEQFFDLTDKIIVPGIIDPHVHISEWLGGRFGHKMLALAGITTAIDFSGPIESVLKLATNYGTGLNIGCINYIRPKYTVKTENPTCKELEDFLLDSFKKGAIGYKILGGHYPLTQEATAKAISIGNKHSAYVAIHAGSLNSASNIEGLKETITLAQGNRLHLAHVNSYCRGQIRKPELEAMETLDILEQNPNIISESYLSPLNGTSANCINGVPDSIITLKCLEKGGFCPTEEGLYNAIKAGWGLINIELGGVNSLIGGEEGAEYWLSKGKTGTISFSVNPGISRYILAVGKDKKGSFIVDAFSSDGGGIPRNVIVEQGINLVKWGAMTLNEFVAKSSYTPAKLLGLNNKGHLGEGVDADITVIDWEKSKPYMTIVSGKLVMYEGVVLGNGTNFITSSQGEENVKGYGLNPIVINLIESGFYND